MEVLAGVLQGSLVGPMLFLWFIRIGSSIRLFADVTSLFVVDDLPEQAAVILNTDLKQFLIGLFPCLKHLMQAK